MAICFNHAKWPNFIFEATNISNSKLCKLAFVNTIFCNAHEQQFHTVNANSEPIFKCGGSYCVLLFVQFGKVSLYLVRYLEISNRNVEMENKWPKNLLNINLRSILVFPSLFLLCLFLSFFLKFNHKPKENIWLCVVVSFPFSFYNRKLNL